MALPLSYLTVPQRLYAEEEIDETIQLAAADFHADRHAECIEKCIELMDHFGEIPFYFQLSIYVLLGSAFQDLGMVKKYHDLAVASYEKARTEHPRGRNQTLDAFLDSIQHIMAYVSDWKNGLEEREVKKRVKRDEDTPQFVQRKKTVRDSFYEPLQFLSMSATT